MKNMLPDNPSLEGHLLLAMPFMEDQRFARSVVYICAHSSDGAMGIIVNKLLPEIEFSELLVQLELVRSDRVDTLPRKVRSLKVHRGGPVETGRGFVLHSADFIVENATLQISGGICLTATLDILRSISEGRGPDKALLALGYAGWGPGQLESEIQANGWLHSPADRRILFEEAVERRYDTALAQMGIDPGMLSADAGHA
ncbi:putative transcriptional regulator [Faunimonas pinastri]|uniref:UPF0301 protein SAMN05216548_101207 n=1 Tax=Faunimonas pinastri TaxID=1855383 RepID=A0A1H8ZNS9_9HYPH|nr:YqgE/AlgH family protein [Faunimonas pinastri]SEP66176.1 putative transcriptional regulator [Faunimonas pinastri]